MMNNLQKYIFLSLAIVVILGAASCSRTTDRGERVDIDKTTEIVLTYDRIFDDKDVLDEIIKNYEEEHPNITIVVRKVNLLPDETIYDYQQDLIKQIADGAGPDIFMIHDDWLPYHLNHISPMPSGLKTTKEYVSEFPQVVVDDFVDGNKIYAVPYYIDNLILFYNTTIFDEARVRTPPRTWQEVSDLVPQLTQYGSGDTIKQSALPFGVADGIPRFADILATLMMQYGVEMTTADRTKATFDLAAPNNPSYFGGKEALDFYTSFANPNKSTYTYTDAYTGAVDEQGKPIRVFYSDLQAFMEGKAAMFIGYAHNIDYIRQFAPGLRFDTALLPQLRLENPIVIANYWGETVSKTSAHPNEAWDFINYVSKYSNLYAYTSKRVPAIESAHELYTYRQYYGPVAQQISFSKSWYRKNTSKIEDIFAQMINNVLHNGVLSVTAIRTATEAVNTLK